MRRDILGFVFTFVAVIEPVRSLRGEVLEFLPQSRYRNARGLALNPHGPGPFCQFRISREFPYKGVYAIAVDGNVAYVGQCENFSERFNERGYGTIHPRNCFEHGQSTNCKVNHLVLESAKRGRRVDLWFHGSASPASIEEHLISNLRPPWNSEGTIASRSRPPERPVKNSPGSPGPTPLPSTIEQEDSMPVFKLTLEKTYYRQGFFNVTVDFDRFVRPTEGPVELVFDRSRSRIEGKINRSANPNGTALAHDSIRRRISGGR